MSIKTLEFVNTYDKSFIILNGNSSVMLSSPHAVKQIREGIIKKAEPQTADIAYTLNTLYKIPAIIKTKCLNDDANYDIDCDYKISLINYCKQNGIEYVVDLHQLSQARAQSFDIGVGGGKYLSKDKLDSVYCLLKNANLGLVEIDKPFSASGRTVCKHLFDNGIKCMQLEINSKLLYSLSGRSQIDEVTSLVKGVVDILKG